MVILGTQNKITDFFMILGWASPFKHPLLEYCCLDMKFCAQIQTRHGGCCGCVDQTRVVRARDLGVKSLA